MSEHESGPLPLDDKPDALHAANELLRKRREMKRHYSAPAIRSGTCSGCDHFTSLVYSSDYCMRCYEEVHTSPQSIILIAKPLQKATEEKAGKRFKESVGALILWAFAMVGVCVVGWFAMRGIGWLFFWLGGAL